VVLRPHSSILASVLASSTTKDFATVKFCRKPLVLQMRDFQRLLSGDDRMPALMLARSSFPYRQLSFKCSDSVQGFSFRKATIKFLHVWRRPSKFMKVISERANPFSSTIRAMRVLRANMSITNIAVLCSSRIGSMKKSSCLRSSFKVLNYSIISSTWESKGAWFSMQNCRVTDISLHCSLLCRVDFRTSSELIKVSSSG